MYTYIDTDQANLGEGVITYIHTYTRDILTYKHTELTVYNIKASYIHTQDNYTFVYIHTYIHT